MSVSIYDQPNHEHYGPVRRLHVMLLQLFSDVSFHWEEKAYETAHKQPWWDHLSLYLYNGMSESNAQRRVLQHFFQSYSWRE